MTVSQKYYSEGVIVESVLRWKDGTFPTADELDQLLAGAYIYSSLHEATKAAAAREATLPRCAHCNQIIR